MWTARSWTWGSPAWSKRRLSTTHNHKVLAYWGLTRCGPFDKNVSQVFRWLSLVNTVLEARNLCVWKFTNFGIFFLFMGGWYLLPSLSNISQFLCSLVRKFLEFFKTHLISSPPLRAPKSSYRVAQITLRFFNELISSSIMNKIQSIFVPNESLWSLVCKSVPG